MKQVLLALVLASTAAVPALADAIPLNAISRYLNGIETAEADFTQINDDGTVSTGHLYLRRPGNMRFEYAGDDLLVMAGGQQVAIFDGRSNTRPDQYPLRETPLSIILDEQVDLSRSNMVVRHEFDGTSTRVVAQDPDRPEIGSLTMVFTPDPIELRQWIVRDETGAETTVVLGALEEGGSIPLTRFSITQEIQRRRGD
ncbi:outer membrane lipoprotein carrier protein LolA [Maritalea mobilis]|uniref:LolA family protein n=1 Tax=Maritalea mobilis TaxID=483324 RepID=UPI001C96698A|nr:outer membrane lipoprotein carrier protein LolA [Maritalea mobilis]MBY6202980.1 outer membrane lipoprotein carrier protein LolA [Maritalea mobilis]